MVITTRSRTLVCVTTAVANTAVADTAQLGALRFTTTLLDGLDNLLAVLPPDPDVLAWVRRGEGVGGWGAAARFEVSGPERFSRAHRWWSRLCADAFVDDAVSCPGSGPVAFASFGFDSIPGNSVLIVPKVVVGHRSGKTWLTTAHPASTTPVGATAEPVIGPASVPQAPGQVQWNEGSRPVAAWKNTVAQAIDRIARGELDKVVLARDVIAETENPLDARRLLQRLSADFPDCWAFSVDRLVGATPELLVRRIGDQVTSRVLAGTVRSDADRGEDGRLAAALLGSGKDQEEHSYAVASVAAALAAHCTDLDVPERPTVLRLANVQHLATDVTGMLADEASALMLAAALHPTAAVCGTPTERAFGLIRQIEGLDRGRYAGPVGWMDSRGDGEFGIALRCGEIDATDPRRIRMFAGCGIVAGSDPILEVAESEAKLLAMRSALS